MNLIDLTILIVLLIFVAVGIKRGFIMSLASLLVTILAITGAKVAADQLSPSVSYVIQPVVEQIVQTEFHNVLPEHAGELEQFQWGAVDDDFWGRMISSQFYQDKLEEFMDAAQKQMFKITEDASAMIAASLSQSIAWVLTYLLAYGIISAVGSLIIKLLDLAAKLPGLRLANRTLGGVLGLVKGALILTVICTLGTGFGLIPEQSARQSVLLGLFSLFRTISQ